MEITLTKTRTYKLEPFGKFRIKWKTRQRHIPNIIPLDESHIKHELSMPMTEEQDKLIVKMMKKAKTDILTDGYAFYTRSKFGSNSTLVEIYHKKLSEYRNDPAFKSAVDLGQTLGAIILNNA